MSLLLPQPKHKWRYLGNATQSRSTDIPRHQRKEEWRTDKDNKKPQMKTLTVFLNPVQYYSRIFLNLLPGWSVWSAKHAYQVMFTFHGRLIIPHYFVPMSLCLEITSFVFAHIDFQIFRNMILICWLQTFVSLRVGPGLEKKQNNFDRMVAVCLHLVNSWHPF